jgi:hypothetical protein
MTLGWVTCNVDFSNAFLQADLKEPVWIHLPRGFRSTHPYRTCLRLKKSQYGLTVAPHLWWKHLTKALHDMGFCPSKYEVCLMFMLNMLLIIYVDDLGVAAPNLEIIDKFIADLESRGFVLTHEGTFSKFLGIKFDEDKQSGTIALTQKGLIKKVIAAAGLRL